MKVVRIYALVVLACFVLGFSTVLILPTPAQAVPSECSKVCGPFYVDCGEQCIIKPGEVGNWYGLGYPYKWDLECSGPYYCSPITYGCSHCQP